MSNFMKAPGAAIYDDEQMIASLKAELLVTREGKMNALQLAASEKMRADDSEVKCKEQTSRIDSLTKIVHQSRCMPNDTALRMSRKELGQLRGKLSQAQKALHTMREAGKLVGFVKDDLVKEIEQLKKENGKLSRQIEKLESDRAAALAKNNAKKC